MDIKQKSAVALGKAIKSRELSSVELIKATFEKIKQIDNKINSFITLTPEAALKQAEEIDKKIAAGDDLPLLSGVPIGIKDNICVENIRSTCGSKILHNFISPYNATVIEKIKDAGLIIIGKMNMDEFAMGSSNETSNFGPVRNPHDLERIPGGSSGGSAAAVAADMLPLTIGSDTGGSIRQPAALCGVVGLKPTYGRVSRYGLIAYASSLDQIGPLANNVEDAAMLLKIISGYDPKDSTSVNSTVDDYVSVLNKDIKNLKLGIPKEYFGKGLNIDMRKKIENSIAIFKNEFKCDIVEISLPHTDYAVAVYYILATAEASSNLSRYDGVKYGYRTENFENLADMYERTRSEGFGNEVKRRIMLGTYALSAGYYDAYYKKAQKVRTLIKRDFENAFQKCDAILTPAYPATAFKFGEKSGNPLEMYLSDIYTISVNLAGLPAISVPCGMINGLPAGLQIIGNNFGESTILNLAYKFETFGANK